LSAARERALVFSQWTSERFGVARLARELREFRPLTYTGALDAQERHARVQAFRTRPEHQVLLLSLRAGGQPRRGALRLQRPNAL
jgi:SNF2 family DNA or RNA helicase